MTTIPSRTPRPDETTAPGSGAPSHTGVPVHIDKDSTLRVKIVYDVVPGDESQWIRLRDTGDETTLTVKQIMTDAIDGTREVEVAVDDFATTNMLLGMLGYTPKSYQENKRTSFALDGAQLEVDTWPHIPPYLEIEGTSTAEVLRIAAILGYAESDISGENTIKIYARHGIDLGAITRLTFD